MGVSWSARSTQLLQGFRLTLGGFLFGFVLIPAAGELNIKNAGAAPGDGANEDVGWRGAGGTQGVWPWG